MISSSQNQKIKLARALTGRARDRRESGAFLVEGVRLIEEARAATWPMIFALYSDHLTPSARTLMVKLEVDGMDVEQVEHKLFESLAETENSQGLIAVLDESPKPVPSLLQFVLIPDLIRDPGNLGTLLRSAAACGVDAVFLPPESTDAFAPKVLRAGMGAHFRIPICEMSWEEIESHLTGLKIFLANMRGISCWEMDLRTPLALIVGGEAEGASAPARKLASAKLAIPMRGAVESLNAGVAGSVLMFEIVRQRSSK